MLAAVDDQRVAGEGRRLQDEAQRPHQVVERDTDAQRIVGVLLGEARVGLAAAAQRQAARQQDRKSGKGAAKPVGKPTGNRTAKLSFKDQHALDRLPDEIEALEDEITALEARLADPDLFAKNPETFTATANRLATARTEKDDKELRWLDAAEKAEALEAEKEES